MKAATHKQHQRAEAIRFYLVDWQGNTYKFMSLYDDNEPYPIEELIQVQKSHIERLEQDYQQCPTVFLDGIILRERQYLTQLEKVQRKAKATPI